MFKGKIFGIGFHKTGTSSFARALDMLGYKVTSSFGLDDPNIAQNALPKAHKIIERFDAFQDNPWPIIYKELDEAYPGSKFVLTLRPEDKWIKSITNHFGGRSTAMREWIYGGHGDPQGKEEIYLARYRQHNDEVRAYFADRPNDLLELRLTEGEGWETLAPFLEIEIPEEEFPHTNSKKERLDLATRLKKRVKKFLKPKPTY